jgi:frataxin
MRRTFRTTTLRRPLLTRSYRTAKPYSIAQQIKTPALLFTVLPAPRTFSNSAIYAAILPDSSDPPPREAEEHDAAPSQKTEITIDEYHILADGFFETLIAKLEARQEAKGDLDVEYAVCLSAHPLVIES